MNFFPKHRYGKTAATVRTMWLFRPDAILDKASHAEEVQLFWLQTPLSERSGLHMEIVYSRSATVRKVGQHHPDAALFKKGYQRIWKASCTVIRLDALSYRPDAA
jgi:hypothetical protein